MSTVWTVSDATHLQAAVDAAQDGDVIEVTGALTLPCLRVAEPEPPGGLAA